MCISQGIELLLLWFEDHDSFILEADYKKLKWDLLKEKNSVETEQKACVLFGLKELENEKCVKFCEEDGKKIWVMVNSQSTAPRNIQVSPQTCENIETVVNAFLPSLDVNISQKSDAKNLGEADIIILLSVIQNLAQQLDDNNNQKRTKKQ